MTRLFNATTKVHAESIARSSKTSGLCTRCWISHRKQIKDVLRLFWVSILEREQNQTNSVFPSRLCQSTGSSRPFFIQTSQIID